MDALSLGAVINVNKCVVEIFWCFAYAFSTTFVILEHHNYISNIVILFLILL
jgi:hypothetical protein